jgi:hypothetical protein
VTTAPTWLVAVLTVLAVYRLSRLVTGDYITRPFRTWVNERYGENRLSYFVTCDWCVSFWVAALVAPVAVWWGDNRAVLAVLLGLTASAVAGLVTGWAE